MTERQKTTALEALDEVGVSAKKVRDVTGMCDAEIDAEMQNGRFPLPVAEMNGMFYWRLGDIARLELGWA